MVVGDENRVFVVSTYVDDDIRKVLLRQDNKTEVVPLALNSEHRVFRVHPSLADVCSLPHFAQSKFV